MFIGVKIVFFSLVGNKLYFICSFIRNVKCVFFSLHPSFSAQAGRLEVPGGLFAFRCVTFFTLNFTLKAEPKILSVFFLRSCVLGG